MQGSGTFGVESVLTSVIGADEKLLICAKGAYGERMEDIVKHAGIDYTIYHEKYDRVPDAGKVNEILFVVYTERIRVEENGEKTDVTRLISARLATNFERGLYYGKCE